MRRAALFIDGSNFYKQCKQYLGTPNVDFTKFRTWIEGRLGLNIVRIYYYNAELPKDSTFYVQQRKFLDALRHLDFMTVRLGVVIKRDDGMEEEKMVDTKIIADMMGFSFSKAYDAIVLVSGDQDLTPGVYYCKNYGCVMYVASFSKDLSSVLARAADFVLEFNKHNMRPLIFRSKGAPPDAEDLPTK